ncbi:MAG TPA: ATP-binding protein [Candidatus Copromorpha excrementigallinarum]|uniref:ATP-binding protein n=1 Tax=Candidatus Allocopromorpha excrementigallinarum TaxID=2840742 RepID=A0A9D1I151_9FIRM|nr:ATP-binding protein [Candidatus Copromorpha excrementigallinarum]
MELDFIIDHKDFDMAGEASSSVKRTLSKLGAPPSAVKRTAISMYEAEINAFIHGGGGTAKVRIEPDKVEIIIKDEGEGIADLELAMQEGWSTADENIRRMGFGAGMGLPNMKKNADVLDIKTGRNQGTEVRMVIYMKSER